jgi:hypothetical protein
MNIYIDTRPQLEWVEYQGRYITNGYEVRFDPIEGKWCWWYYDETEDQPYYEDPYHAKAAAQADYDRRTAERFRKVKVRDKMYYGLNLEDYEYGYNQALEDIHEAIDKANES